MLISCLMPTFNRYPQVGYLVEEAVECFLRQDHKDKELILCNDLPGQQLSFNHPKVRVINAPNKFPTLGEKLRYMIQEAQGDLFCRWDDDDINLPNRLSYSIDRLVRSGKQEWRPENYWYDPGTPVQDNSHGNTHVSAIWHRAVLGPMGGYPVTVSGAEDQAFNQALRVHGITQIGEHIPTEDMFYMYRWGTGGVHLSGDKDMQRLYDHVPADRYRGLITIKPRWHQNHLDRVRLAMQRKAAYKPITDVAGYYDYAKLYERAVDKAHRHGRLVEVGCLFGRSLCDLGRMARAAGKRLAVYGVDYGVGIGWQMPGPENNPGGPVEEFADTKILVDNIRQCGMTDIVTLLVGESMRIAGLFEDNSLDFVFIDASHTYQAVRGDLQAWFPKVRQGGLIAGHDYIHPTYPGVALAVDEFFGTKPLGCQVSDVPSCWMRLK